MTRPAWPEAGSTDYVAETAAVITDLQDTSDSVSAWAARARGNRVIGIGDSIMAGGVDYSVGRLVGYTSPFTYACIFSKQRIRHFYNAGVASETSTQIEARFDTDVVARDPAAALIWAGTNDDLDTEYLPTTVNLQSMINEALAAGILPVLLTLPANNSDTGSIHLNRARLRFWCINQAAKLGIPLVDTFAITNDPETGDWLSGYSGDGVHPTELAARAIGQQISDVLSPLLPDTPLYLHSDGSDTGNLCENGCFIGDTNTDGVANVWFASGSGGTPTYSLETGTLPVVGNWQKLEVTGSSPDRHLLSQVISTGFAPGDTLEFSCRIKSVGVVAAGHRINVGVITADGTPSQVFPLYNAIFDADYGAVYARFDVPTGTSAMRVDVGISGSSGTVSVEVAQVSLVNLTTLGVD